MAVWVILAADSTRTSNRHDRFARLATVRRSIGEGLTLSSGRMRLETGFRLSGYLIFAILMTIGSRTRSPVGPISAALTYRIPFLLWTP